MNRRQFLRVGLGSTAAATFGGSLLNSTPAPAYEKSQYDKVVNGACDWVAKTQSRSWELDCNSTGLSDCDDRFSRYGIDLPRLDNDTRQVLYQSTQVRRFPFESSGANGLIGDPRNDDRYTYGHGYAMMFLSQVLGEEEDEQRRKELTEVLNKAVKFTLQAQTTSGGWGYVGLKDGSDFDEGSTTITQVQGLRGCRNAESSCLKKESRKQSPTFKNAPAPTAVSLTAPKLAAAADLRSRLPRLHAFTMPVTTKTKSYRSRCNMLIAILPTSDQTTMVIGTTPTITMLRSSIARVQRNGIPTAIKFTSPD